ncbi:hypothetical protein PHISP_02703 [Aspergillus sp. HF37]|nr:hypothetical protein PHISP_02703 [Aspergillus sp. HF37]
MGKTKNAARPLTHDEIWDDSALIQSWDEAVEEYKLYHSIHAKGENVDDVLREAEAAEEPPEQDDYMDAENEAPADGNVQAEIPAAAEQKVQELQQREGASHVPGISLAAGAGAAPQAALGQVQDEGLKNLMMSWYFAGYYTGLYEGQQRTSQSKGL